MIFPFKIICSTSACSTIRRKDAKSVIHHTEKQDRQDRKRQDGQDKRQKQVAKYVFLTLSHSEDSEYFETTPSSAYSLRTLRLCGFPFLHAPSLETVHPVFFKETRNLVESFPWQPPDHASPNPTNGKEVPCETM